jgi:hypothetical protein
MATGNMPATPCARYSSTEKSHEYGGVSVTDAEVVFCTDLTETPEEDRRVRAYYLYALANAVQEGKITAEQARYMFEPYGEHMPWLYDPDEIEEFESGFPDMDYFMELSTGPGTSGFWEDADKLGIDGVYFNEGEHPGGSPVSTSTGKML